MEDGNLYIRLRKMSHTIYVTRIILPPLSALFGSQFMLPMKTSVTFIGACANEIIRRNNSGFFLAKGRSEVMLELVINYFLMSMCLGKSWLLVVPQWCCKMGYSSSPSYKTCLTNGPISSCKKVRKCCNPHVYWWNCIGFKQSHFVEDLVATPTCMFLVGLFWRWDVVSLTTPYPFIFHR